MREILNQKILLIITAFLLLHVFIMTELQSQTEILKWMDGRSSCISITFDDGSRNQFKIAMPILDELELQATFFINTGNFTIPDVMRHL